MNDLLSCLCGKAQACAGPNCHHPGRELAVVSDCGTYRYRLERDLKPLAIVENFPVSQPLLWVMCNPSTADARLDDPTIRKVRAFTALAGYSRLIVVNVAAYRATKSTELRLLKREAALGPWNHDHIAQAAMFANKIVVAWGKAMPKNKLGLITEAIDILKTAAPAKPLHCLGTTADGVPRHPLMIPYSQELVEWQR